MTFTLLDGGMGQELIARSKGKATPLWATQVMLDQPELVESIHLEYFDAGADVATVNSYGLHRDRLQPNGIEDQFNQLHIRACEIASRARDKTGRGIVAGSMGPTGASYRPDLALDEQKGAEVYAEIAKIQAPFVDVFLLETLSSIKQARGAAMGASSVGKPVWLSISVDDEDGTKLRSGEPVTDIIQVAKDTKVEALLINCSPPEAVTIALEVLGKQPFKIGAYANGFTRINDAFKQDRPTVDVLESRTDLDPQAYYAFAKQWRDLGADIIGGCCEVGPAHIQFLHQHMRAD